MALVALVAVKSASGASFKLQESKQATPDKRAEALKKYLEAQRLEQAGNLPGRQWQLIKRALVLDPQSVELRTALGSLYLKESQRDRCRSSGKRGNEDRTR
jgi:thioredoxin-like negative regulator of GroEL